MHSTVTSNNLKDITGHLKKNKTWIHEVSSFKKRILLFLEPKIQTRNVCFSTRLLMWHSFYHGFVTFQDHIHKIPFIGKNFFEIGSF